VLTIFSTVLGWAEMFRCNLVRSLGVLNSNKQSPFSGQFRSNWQVVLGKRVDKRTGKSMYEDWDYLSMSMHEPTLLNGNSLLNRHQQQTVHIKPTELKRRLNSAKTYKRSVKRLDDLKNYIKFIQEAERKED
jgi:hypothetical protein